MPAPRLADSILQGTLDYGTRLAVGLYSFRFEYSIFNGAISRKKSVIKPLYDFLMRIEKS